jgi:catecholate siderophore receptor
MARRRQAGGTPRRPTDSERLILNPKRHLRRAIGLGLLVTSSAWAQQPTDEDLVLPPVDVQAQRRFGEYRLLNSDLFKVPSELADHPQSVTIVPQELMREQADFTLREAFRNVTGISFVAGEAGGAQGDNLTLRGFSARTDIFLDGIRDVGMYTRDTFNLEAVEVFKGRRPCCSGAARPAVSSTRSARPPRRAASTRGPFSGGTDVFFRGQADVNQPIGSVAALRLNVMGQSNDIAERDEADIKRWGIASSLTIGFGTPLQVTGSFFYQREDTCPTTDSL